MNTFSEYIAESSKPRRLPADAPMQFADFEKAAEAAAKRLKCGLDSYPAGDRKFVAEQRARLLRTVWNSCLMEVKPNGFDGRFAEAAIMGGIYPFCANEVRAEEWSPARWRRAVVEWIVSSFEKDSVKWTQSRYEASADRSGKKFVASKW